MKQINYVMKVKKVDTDDSTAWEETMNYNVENNVTIEEHATLIIERFNNSLRPYEEPRKLVSVTAIGGATDNSIKIPHTWTKSSLVTEKGGFDKMKCSVCGATGKRFGLGQFGVRIDPKFKKYNDHCPGPK